ncbi:hypothetical protein ACTQ42_07135 [Streptococcus alactolyticus]|uniref:hypothetical protein n=1 Tax=Streptococcus alactolyticus TaxID=29389 RepID=UPI003F94CACE
MIYQETVFPIWADILIMIIVPIVIFLLLTYEPPAKEEEKQVQEIKTDNHIQERYGAYIQSQGRYYN